MHINFGPFKVIKQDWRRPSEDRVKVTNSKLKLVKTSDQNRPVDSSVELPDDRKKAIAEWLESDRKRGILRVCVVSVIIILLVCFSYQMMFPEGYHWSGIHP